MIVDTESPSKGMASDRVVPDDMDRLQMDTSRTDGTRSKAYMTLF